MALLLLLTAAPVRADGVVDLELVLAVDASGSVSDAEYALQMGGIAAAFRDAEVQAAIGRGKHGRISVALMIWAESNRPKAASAWHVVGDAAGAERFAAAVERFPRTIPSGGTGIGRAVMYALGMLDRNGYDGERKVIDVSGDGVETTFREYSVPPEQAREGAFARGVTINGLAILTEEPHLDEYFRTNVIGGPGAFVEVAHSYEDFARAMQRKLLREVEARAHLSLLEASGQ